MPTLAFSPGPWELVLILAVVLLIFGSRKLPQLARSMGSSITQFKKGLKEEPELLDEGKADPVPGSEAARKASGETPGPGPS